MGKDDPKIVITVPFDYPFEFMRGDDYEEIEFHFHALKHRHDCFRYWAHNPRVMRDSLTDRSFNEEQIDDFMSLMLYRQSAFSPGIARPEPVSA
jgi:hypothetical protein